MTLPAFGAGPVGLDAVAAWLRGITGEPASSLAAAAPPSAATASTATAASEPMRGQGARPPSLRPAVPMAEIPLADAGDLVAATNLTVVDPSAPATGLGNGALRGRQPDRASAARAVAPTGPQRVLPDDPQAEGEDPFQPQRYRIGGFTVQPMLDASIGRTSNMQAKAGGSGGALYRLRPEATIASDWSRHALEATVRGGYDGYPSDNQLDTPTYDASAKLRLDLMDTMRADMALRLSSARGKASSAENPADTVVPSTTTTTGASLGVTREAGIIGITLRGDVDRTAYSGGQLASGAAISSDAARDNTRVALALRASLASAAIVQPYVEVQAIRRGYDAETMSGRDGRGVAGLVGARLDFGPLLRGDVAAGWTREVLADSSLSDLAGATFDAVLVWAPTRLTQVTATARTTFDPTTLADSSGSVGHRVGVTVKHALARDIIASAGVGGEQRHYTGITLEERTITGEAELAYRLDPHLELYGRGEWSRFASDAAGADYRNVTVMTGLRLR